MISTKLLNYNLKTILKISYLSKTFSQLRNLSCDSSLTSSDCQQRSAQNLVIDLSFDDKMTSNECQRLAREIYAIYCMNNSLKDIETQFNISLCNESFDNSLTIEYLRQYLPQIHSTNDIVLHNFQIYNKSYLEVFDRKRLVYLTPDADQVVTYDTNDIYIIGGIVDKYCFKSKRKLLTNAKALREGLRSGKFPIDHLISDKMKSKLILFLPQVFGILSVVKETQNWETAVKTYLPLWKLKDYKPLINERMSCYKR